MKILDAYSDEVWEQRRYEIAKDMFVKYIGDCKITSDDDIMKRGESMSRYMARMSVEYADIFCGGACDLVVEWLPIGAKFLITEFDGAEDIITIDDLVLEA